MGSTGLVQQLAKLQDGITIRFSTGVSTLLAAVSYHGLANPVAHCGRATNCHRCWRLARHGDGVSRTMREALYPLLVGFNAIPKATVVPIVALMFVGAHDFNTILIAFMISFFPIAVSISIGLSTLEPEYRDILRALGASKTTIFWKIALPKTLPEFFGALKVAVTLAFIGTNLMEIVSPHGRGLGALFDSGKTNSDYPLMFAVLIALAFLGIVLYYVVVFLEKIFAGWAEREPT